ncbi:MAG: DUF1211 domain-containing protein [Cryobacterium sp.]|nr:DUF1211 domain-containing protein [Cryobacterium sp.]
MGTTRLEAFSDGVMAIIITIMVLEIGVPVGHDFSALIDELGTSILSYLLSFVYVGIYWNNHHHLFHLVSRSNGGILWANLHLLFWLSLLPITTAWMDESDFARAPVVIYGTDLLLCAIAWAILQRVIIRDQGSNSLLRDAVGKSFKVIASPVLYLAGIVSGLFISTTQTWPAIISLACFAVTALLWVVPDRKIESLINSKIQTD